MSKENYHRNLLNIDYKILKYAGIWTEDEYKKNSIIYIIYAMFINFFIYLPFTTSHAIRAYFVVGINMSQLADICYILIGISLIQLYAVYMFVYRKEVRHLNKLMETENSKIVTKTHTSIVKQNIKIWKLFRRIHYSFVLFELILYLLSCIMPIIQKENRSLLFVNFWIPFDINKSPNFEYAFLVRTFTIISASFGYISFHYVFIGYFSFITTQCEILCYNLKHVKEFPDENALEFQCKLSTCVQQYIHILEFKNLVIKVFGTPFFALIVVMTVDICLSAFFLSVTEIDTDDILFQIWFAIELLQCFAFLVPCWFASRITDKSDSISYAIFESPWTDASISFKKSMICFCQQTEKPIEIKFVGIFSMSIPIFITVVRRSFSLYTMLTTLNEE